MPGGRNRLPLAAAPYRLLRGREFRFRLRFRRSFAIMYIGTAAGVGGECICVYFLWTYLSGGRSILEYNVDQLGDDKDASPGGARCLDIFLILILKKIVLGLSAE